eukprot:Pgem_evm1s10691
MFLERLFATRNEDSVKSYKLSADLYHRLHLLSISECGKNSVTFREKCLSLYFCLSAINLTSTVDNFPNDIVEFNNWRISELYLAFAFHLKLHFPKYNVPAFVCNVLAKFYTHLAKREIRDPSFSSYKWIFQDAGYQYFHSNCWTEEFRSTSCESSLSPFVSLN